jgi:putative iron-only hydrogenase system regulator
MSLGKGLSLVSILVDERGERAPRVQEVVTEFGSEIIGRFGVPSPSKEKGLITLAMEAERARVDQLVGKLKTIEGVEIATAHFNNMV